MWKISALPSPAIKLFRLNNYFLLECVLAMRVAALDVHCIVHFLGLDTHAHRQGYKSNLKVQADDDDAGTENKTKIPNVMRLGLFGLRKPVPYIT